jgi:isopropylmalate/isohomocitrate dehydrogenase-like protein|tara:strand:- start:1254 stop:2252 length:999 start_codon:yes stop_codon:yes gene_type:complete
MKDMYDVAVVPGDGIGKEVVPEAVRALESTGLEFNFHRFDVGYEVFKRDGNPVPNEAIVGIKQNPVCLFGATTTPLGIPNYSSAILTLRKALGVYANIRPAKSCPVRWSRDGVDLVVVRENTEGLYSGIEFGDRDRAYTLRVISLEASERIAKCAFKLAMSRRRQLTLVTKANVLRKTDGLFRDVSLGVAEEHPEVEVNELLVDVAAMHIVMKPQIFDVILAPNLYGDILSDEAAGLVGGLGLAPSASIGDDYALFEPVHGSAPDIAGKGIANPMAAILSAKMMLEHIGEDKWAHKLEAAVISVLMEGKHLTPDIGGNSTTLEVTDAIIKAL